MSYRRGVKSNTFHRQPVT